MWDVKEVFKQMGSHRRIVQEISTDNRSVYIKEDEYIFRNIFGTIGFMEGIHYWEIVCDARTEHELKIGVSKINKMEDSSEF